MTKVMGRFAWVRIKSKSHSLPWEIGQFGDGNDYVMLTGTDQLYPVTEFDIGPSLAPPQIEEKD